jgi:hypothetical protein
MYRFLIRVLRWLRAEIVFGFLIATVFWAGVLGWQAANVPTDAEKQKCYDAAEKAHHKTEECKTLWQRTTSDPVAFFTFWLVLSTIGLGISTVMLWGAGEKQFRHARRSSAIQSRDMKASIAVAERSASAAERALRDLERPWIFVFDQSRATRDPETDEFFIEYTVANYGKLPAIISQPLVGFVFNGADGNPQFPMLPDESHSLVASPILAVGEQRRLREYFPLNDTGEITFRVVNPELPDEKSLEAVPNVALGPSQNMFFRGLISYHGPGSNGHQTSVSWLYMHPFDFVSRGGPEYNYNE